MDKKSLTLLAEMLESFGPAGFEVETASIVKKPSKLMQMKSKPTNLAP